MGALCAPVEKQAALLTSGLDAEAGSPSPPPRGPPSQTSTSRWESLENSGSEKPGRKDRKPWTQTNQQPERKTPTLDSKGKHRFNEKAAHPTGGISANLLSGEGFTSKIYK